MMKSLAFFEAQASHKRLEPGIVIQGHLIFNIIATVVVMLELDQTLVRCQKNHSIRIFQKISPYHPEHQGHRPERRIEFVDLALRFKCYF